MGRAAERLGMAQPPLSQSIARLEQSLGVRLFRRAHRRLSLTDAGMAFLDEARLAVRHADAAMAQAQASAVGSSGEIRIGFVPAALYEQLPQLLRRLRQSLPQVSCRLFEMSSNEQLQGLADGRLDIAFGHPPFVHDQPLDVHILAAEESIAVLPDSGQSGPVTLAQVAGFGLILFPASQGPSLHRQILDCFADAGVEVQVSALTMLALVAAGLGAALLPRSIRRVSFAGVRYAEISDARLPSLSLAIVSRQGAVRPVVQRVRQLFAQWIA